MKPRVRSIWAKTEVARVGDRTGVAGAERGVGAGPGRKPWPEKYDHPAGRFDRTAVRLAVESSWDRAGSIPAPVVLAVAWSWPVWATWATICTIADIPAPRAGMFQTLVPGTNVPRVGVRARTNRRPDPSDSVTATFRAVPGPVFRTVRVTRTTPPTVAMRVLTTWVTFSAARTGVTVVLAVLFPAWGSGWSVALMAELIDLAPVAVTLALIWSDTGVPGRTEPAAHVPVAESYSPG